MVTTSPTIPTSSRTLRGCARHSSLQHMHGVYGVLRHSQQQGALGVSKALTREMGGSAREKQRKRGVACSAWKEKAGSSITTLTRRGCVWVRCTDIHAGREDLPGFGDSSDHQFFLLRQQRCRHLYAFEQALEALGDDVLLQVLKQKAAAHGRWLVHAHACMFVHTTCSAVQP